MAEPNGLGRDEAQRCGQNVWQLAFQTKKVMKPGCLPLISHNSVPHTHGVVPKIWYNRNTFFLSEGCILKLIPDSGGGIWWMPQRYAYDHCWHSKAIKEEARFPKLTPPPHIKVALLMASDCRRQHWNFGDLEASSTAL